MPQSDSKRNGCVLTIAGSDSGAGAGIQADLKTFAAHGLYGLTVVTLVTAQNTTAVSHVEVLPPDVVRAQLESVFADFDIRAVKTGALGTSAVIEAVADFFTTTPPPNLVIDPVMISKHGHQLIDDNAIATLKDMLLPFAACVTPNLPEASAFVGHKLGEETAALLDAGHELLATGARGVVIKGGHMGGAPNDLLVTPTGHMWFSTERIESTNTHGTGCTFSSAIAANLALGHPLAEAVGHAKLYITGAISAAQSFGKGINPVNHFWRTSPEFGRLS